MAAEAAIDFLDDFLAEAVLAAGAEAAAAAGAAAALTVTIGEIFLIEAAEIPALDKSLTEEYGRPAMIFFAVEAPMPGTASSSDSEAVFRSTGLEGAVLALALFVLFAFLVAVAAVCGKEGAAKSASPRLHARMRTNLKPMIGKSYTIQNEPSMRDRVISVHIAPVDALAGFNREIEKWLERENRTNRPQM